MSVICVVLFMKSLLHMQCFVLVFRLLTLLMKLRRLMRIIPAIVRPQKRVVLDVQNNVSLIIQFMVVIVQKKKSASIVKGCVSVTNVLVQLTPQSQPFDLDFPDNSDAMEYVARLHQPDGESFAQSVQSYMNSGK